jgi:SAM-dependent methyltransferase
MRVDDEILACPRCKHPFGFSTSSSLTCRRCEQQYDIRDDIPQLIDTTTLPSPAARDEFEKNLAWFEQYHRSQSEPWKYSERAAEIVKRLHILKEIQRYCPAPDSVLDIGCSMGQLSRLLNGVARKYYAIDISPSAIQKAHQWWKTREQTPAPAFLVASATALPFRRESFDLLICLDGLYGMDMTEELQGMVLRECYAALRPGGTMIFTDYLRPERFDDMLRQIADSPFSIIRVHYLYDRLWYQLESWLRMIEHWRWVKVLLRNQSFAQTLSVVSRLFGKYGSKHICVVAKKLEEC